MPHLISDVTAIPGVGIDLGGSKIRGAIADSDGRIHGELTEKTDLAGGRRVLDQIQRMVEQLQATSGLTAERVAVGSPGVMDIQGRFQLSFNIDDLAELALADELQDRLKVPVAVENDVNIAALGEQWQGLGSGHRNFAVLALGTGLGMGLVVNGRLHRGARGFAGEIAYLPIGADPRSEGSRRIGALETAVGTHGLLHRYSEAGGRAHDAIEVFNAASDGDEIARQVVDEEAYLVAQAILAVCTVIDPELVIMTGGMGADPVFVDQVRSATKEICPHDVRIERSQLGERAGVVGAVAAALYGLDAVAT